MSNARRSLADLQDDYNKGSREPLDKLVKAFVHIQSLKPDDPNSFQVIAGYHGEPFRDNTPPSSHEDGWWGGYCFHGCVLFPTWHRAYLLRLERALQTAPGCEDVMLPFWDECSITGDSTGANIIPEVLTWVKYPLDGKQIPNPLYSFKLQAKLDDDASDKNRYTKPEGYETVRYPLSGLVGTAEDQEETTAHNALYPDPDECTKYLNENVSNWLLKGPNKDTLAVLTQYKRCLQVPDYTTFSNTESAKHKMTTREKQKNPQYVVPLESPHNAIHLAVGGFYDPGDGNINDGEIPGANGDMGENNTASFDPIFYLHHCFVDYVFWQWQKRHEATKGFEINEKDPGAKVPPGGMVNLPAGTVLTMDSPLEPFVNPKSSAGNLYTSKDLVDIEALGYTYGPGSLDEVDVPSGPDVPNRLFAVSNINRADYEGSFVIRTYATTDHLESQDITVSVEVGREPILSRWNIENCANCQNHLDAVSFIPISQEMLDLLLGDDQQGDLTQKIRFHVAIQNHKRVFKVPHSELGAPGKPALEHLT
ncbi:Di-copper centre-containing protein [Aspergillus steynii IBT 23096]|uniref:tyrosinase n=1 Tax=Aspergillus steynii IBT 23096 TaxID=1392250 RepID=A0A2I2FVC4_9EURO|nr:Di-copper centre-containing protein [Aspergillus steynii IBT 23096]PLB44561.1 Di-copper centre-containing protein [Aspergillus steynii IBT 23096]